MLRTTNQHNQNKNSCWSDLPVDFSFDVPLSLRHQEAVVGYLPSSEEDSDVSQIQPCVQHALHQLKEEEVVASERLVHSLHQLKEDTINGRLSTLDPLVGDDDLLNLLNQNEDDKNDIDMDDDDDDDNDDDLLHYYNDGDIIIHQNDIGLHQYQIVNGSVTVHVGFEHLRKQVAVLTAPDTFGEIAMMTKSQRRTATIIASGSVCLKIISRQSPSLSRKIPLSLNHRALDLASSDDVKELFFSSNDVIIRQGEIGDCFYVLTSGTVDVTIDQDDDQSFYVPPLKVNTMISGEVFGESALMSPSKQRTANCIARGECKILQIGFKQDTPTGLANMLRRRQSETKNKVRCGSHPITIVANSQTRTTPRALKQLSPMSSNESGGGSGGSDGKSQSEEETPRLLMRNDALLSISYHEERLKKGKNKSRVSKENSRHTVDKSSRSVGKGRERTVGINDSEFHNNSNTANAATTAATTAAATVAATAVVQQRQESREEQFLRQQKELSIASTFRKIDTTVSRHHRERKVHGNGNSVLAAAISKSEQEEEWEWEKHSPSFLGKFKPRDQNGNSAHFV